MKRIIIYLVSTFGFSWLFWGIGLLAQNEILPEFLGLLRNLAIFGPLFGFVVITKTENKKIWPTIKSLFKGPYPKALYYLTLLMPFIISSLAYIIVMMVNDLDFELGLSIQMIVPVGLIILFVGGPVEEFGWRGFLHPELRSKYNIFVVTLVVGLIHGIWHLPLHFLEGTVQEVIPIYEYMIITVLGAFSYSFIYEYTKSLTPMILLHWFNNLSSAIFIYWQYSLGRYMLLVLTIIVDIVLIIILMKRRQTKTAS